MKYIVSLVIGMITGAALLLFGYYKNPFVGRAELSPLAVSETGLANLSFSTVTTDAILFTNNGEAVSRPFPAKVAELWEPTVSQSEVLVTTLIDSRGLPAGIGIKMSSPSEATRLVDSKLLVDSVWHLYMPGRGTLAIYQQEDYWSYMRDVVIPAWRSSSDSWRGTWSRNMTVGPGALRTARVYGLGGSFDGIESEAVESLNARAYSYLQGPVSISGTLSIVIPDESAEEPQAAAQQTP